jgi:hypothetical protein
MGYYSISRDLKLLMNREWITNYFLVIGQIRLCYPKVSSLNWGHVFFEGL